MTTVNKSYTPYIPLWEKCIETQYPEYEKRVFRIDDGISYYNAACMRFLIDPPGDWDYCYITDVDMMIMREGPPLHEFHLNEMAETGLPYSNVPRKSEERGPERLTGLHFVSRRWFDVTAESVYRHTQSLFRGDIGNNRIDDELMLMNIVRESGLAVPPTKHLSVRHHGIHLGTMRAYKTHTRKRREEELRIRITPARALQWQKIAKGVLREEIENITDAELKWEFKELDRFTNKRMRQ